MNMERRGTKITRSLLMALIVIMTLQADIFAAEDTEVEMCVRLRGYKQEREPWPLNGGTSVEEQETQLFGTHLYQLNQPLTTRINVFNYTYLPTSTTTFIFQVCEKWTCTCELASSYAGNMTYMIEFAMEAINDRGMPMGHWEVETKECPFKSTVIDTSSFQSLECTEPGKLRADIYQEYTPGMFYFLNKEASNCVSFCMRWTYVKNPLFNPKSVEFQIVRYVSTKSDMPVPPDITYRRNSGPSGVHGAGTTFFSIFGKFLFSQTNGIITGALTFVEWDPKTYTVMNKEYLELVKAASNISVPRTLPIKSQMCLLFHPEIPAERRHYYNYDIYTSNKNRNSTEYFETNSPITSIGRCIALAVYPLGGVDNEIHVSFIKYPHKYRKNYTECSHYDIKEFTLQALMPSLYPSNVMGRSKNTFRLAHKTSDSNNCVGEDLTLDQIQSLEIKFLPCLKTPRGDADWLMKDYPPEMVWMRLNKDSQGACFTWSLGPAVKNSNPGHLDAPFIFVSFVSELLVHELGKEPYVVHMRAARSLYWIFLSHENETLAQETGNITHQQCHQSVKSDPKTSKYGWIHSSLASDVATESKYGVTYLLTSYYSVNCAVKDKYAKRDPITGEIIDGCSIPQYKGDFPTYPYPSGGTNTLKHNSVPAAITPKTGAEESISDQSYELCNIVKACFAPCATNKDCISGRFCEPLVVLNSPKYLPGKRKQEVIIEILAPGAKRVAIALSQDDNINLGDDYVIECKQESNGDFNLYTSWRTNTTTYAQPNPATTSVSLEVGSNDESTLYCRFHLKFKFSITPILPQNRTLKEFTFDFNWEKYYMFVVTGETNSSSGDKGMQKRTGACAFAEQIDFSHVFGPNDSQKKLLRHHGFILVVVWFILLPIGIFMGRYLKETDITVTVCRIRLWKFAHILLMTLSFALFMWSFFELFVGVIGWNAGDAENVQFHFYGGYLVFLLFLWEIITGCWGAEEIYEEGIDVIRVIHGFCGHSMYILGVFVFMFSSSLRYSGLSCSVNAAVIVWLIVYILMQIPIWLQYLWLDYIYCDGWAGISTGIFLFNRLMLSNDDSMDAPGSTLRRRVTFGFSIVSAMFALIMVILMSTGSDLCFHEEAKHDVAKPEPDHDSVGNNV